MEGEQVPRAGSHVLRQGPGRKPTRAVTPISARQLLRRRSPGPAGAPRSQEGQRLREDELAPAERVRPTTASAASTAVSASVARGKRLSAA